MPQSLATRTHRNLFFQKQFPQTTPHVRFIKVSAKAKCHCGSGSTERLLRLLRQCANFIRVGSGGNAQRSPRALTCELYSKEKKHSTRRALAIHEGNPGLAPETRPRRGSAPAPCQSRSGRRERLGVFPEKAVCCLTCGNLSTRACESLLLCWCSLLE